MTDRIKQGDLLPPWQARLYDGADPQPLDAATQVRVKAHRNGVLVFDRIAVGDATGLVTMQWELGDTAVVGTLNCEVEVIWPGNRPQTFPSRGTLDTRIYSDLD